MKKLIIIVLGLSLSNIHLHSASAWVNNGTVRGINAYYFISDGESVVNGKKYIPSLCQRLLIDNPDVEIQLYFDDLNLYQYQVSFNEIADIHVQPDGEVYITRYNTPDED